MLQANTRYRITTIPEGAPSATFLDEKPFGHGVITQWKSDVNTTEFYLLGDRVFSSPGDPDPFTNEV